MDFTNMIRARGFYHRRFIKFLEELDADYPDDLLYHSNIRSLNLAKSCQRL